MPRDFATKGNGALALTGASQAIIAANPNRLEITICNSSAANAMWLALAGHPTTPGGAVVAPTAAASTGIRLGPGQSYTTTNYRGAFAILGTAADIATWVEV